MLGYLDRRTERKVSLSCSAPPTWHEQGVLFQTHEHAESMFVSLWEPESHQLHQKEGFGVILAGVTQ